MTVSALITGCSGPVLTAEEIAFLREFDPWGLILFQRNCHTPEQVKALVSCFRDLNGRSDAPVLIDQEGGRVQRLKPPVWRKYPTARTFGELYRKDRDEAVRAVYLITRLISGDLENLGINVDCLPVLDVPQSGADNIIGDRAYGGDAETVALLARSAARGLLDGGVLPVIKHIPGHGRATVDSHKKLPRVHSDAHSLCQVDFAPFRELSDLPLAMTAHVVFEAFDAGMPATLSAPVIENVIRGHMGFDGVLITDDLSMKALSGSFGQRTSAAFAAGCDIALHCNGDMGEMRQVASHVPGLEGTSLARAQAALKRLVYPQEFDREYALLLHSRLVQNSV